MFGEKVAVLEEKFSSLRFHQVQKEMAHVFFLPEEFPRLDRGDEPAAAISTAMGVPEESFCKYALTLSVRGVENLLLVLPAADEGEERCVLRVLDVRMSPRLFGLLWALYQYHPDSRPVHRALNRAVIANRELAPDNCLPCLTGSEEDKVSGATRILISRGGDIGAFCAEFMLIPHSPFAQGVVRKFFSLCAVEMIEKNESYFRHIIENETGDSFSAAVKNYLSQMDRTEELQDINVLLLSRVGRPGYSPFWHEIDGRMVARFESWYFSYELGQHFNENSKKMELLSSYACYIKEITSDEDGVIRINFGKFVVLDGGDRDEDSFYIAHPGQGMAADYRELWENRQKFGSARDFVLDTSEASVFRLSYHETGILFTGEMLDILLGLKLDMRKKNIEGVAGATPVPQYNMELQ